MNIPNRAVSNHVVMAADYTVSVVVDSGANGYPGDPRRGFWDGKAVFP